MRALKRKLQDVKRSMRELAQAARDEVRRAAESEGRSGTVNAAVRYNIQVQANIGSDGSEKMASATQYAPIRQGPKAE